MGCAIGPRDKATAQTLWSSLPLNIVSVPSVLLISMRSKPVSCLLNDIRLLAKKNVKPTILNASTTPYVNAVPVLCVRRFLSPRNLPITSVLFGISFITIMPVFVLVSTLPLPVEDYPMLYSSPAFNFRASVLSDQAG